MQSFLRALNIVCSPVLTLYFASRLPQINVLGTNRAEMIGGALAGLVVLGVEVVLGQGPKHSAWIRRWLDPRAAFEGSWIQDVYRADGDNRFGIFHLDYVADGDSFGVAGAAYSLDGSRWATWESQHMFIDKGRMHATYLFAGETRSSPSRYGVVELNLRRPPPLSIPLVGKGSVSHVGDQSRVEFDMRRITSAYLRELGLRFSLRDLRRNAHREEQGLVDALLEQQHVGSPRAPVATT